MEYRNVVAFEPHFAALARIAYFKNPIKSVSLRREKIHKFFRVIVWFLVTLYNAQHVVNVVVHRHNTDRVVDTLFILLTTLNTLGKQTAFNLRTRRIDKIISVIDGPLFAPTRPNHVAAMKTNANVMKRLLNLNIGAIFTCGTLWTIFPLVNKALGEEVRFSAYFPYDTSSSPVFELTVAYMSILVTFQAYGNVTMDCMIVAFYAQVKLQLNMLRNNMEELLSSSDISKKLTKRGKAKFVEAATGFVDVDDAAFGEVLQKKLATNVEHYRMIVWFLEEVEKIFAEALFFQFLISAWVVCMTVYKIVDFCLGLLFLASIVGLFKCQVKGFSWSCYTKVAFIIAIFKLNPLSAEFVSMAMYIICILTQLFFYCYYGSQVKTESELVTTSIYSCDWVSLSPRFRRQLLLMMTRCSRPLAPKVAYIIHISLDTFLAVIKSSYTLFTFLSKRK